MAVDDPYWLVADVPGMEPPERPEIGVNIPNHTPPDPEDGPPELPPGAIGVAMTPIGGADAPARPAPPAPAAPKAAPAPAPAAPAAEAAAPTAPAANPGDDTCPLACPGAMQPPERPEMGVHTPSYQPLEPGFVAGPPPGATGFVAPPPPVEEDEGKGEKPAAAEAATPEPPQPEPASVAPPAPPAEAPARPRAKGAAPAPAPSVAAAPPPQDLPPEGALPTVWAAVSDGAIIDLARIATYGEGTVQALGVAQAPAPCVRATFGVEGTGGVVVVGVAPAEFTLSGAFLGKVMQRGDGERFRGVFLRSTGSLYLPGTPEPFVSYAVGRLSAADFVEVMVDAKGTAAIRVNGVERWRAAFRAPIDAPLAAYCRLYRAGDAVTLYSGKKGQLGASVMP
eukprot:TRINITY_DN1939_c0_g1_i1.p1 TRINITY_DN1939_c0_g1~~TRINITY_DN1939_c0_g1_i1.p1  ORF type:complete len:417 (+),score=67.50 TRINITY_DN1939_c0_g1_i1:68-1252(+)